MKPGKGHKRLKSLLLGILLVGSPIAILLSYTPKLWTSNPDRPLFVIIWDSKDNRSANGFVAVSVFTNSTHKAETIVLNVDKGFGFGRRLYTVGNSYDFIGTVLNTATQTQTQYNFGYQTIQTYNLDPNYFVVRLILPPNVYVDSNGNLVKV